MKLKLSLTQYSERFFYWACSITLGNKTRFIHRVGYLIYQLPLFHISVVYNLAPMYLLQSVILVRVTRICPMPHYNLL